MMTTLKIVVTTVTKMVKVSVVVITQAKARAMEQAPVVVMAKVKMAPVKELGIVVPAVMTLVVKMARLNQMALLTRRMEPARKG